MKKAEITSQVCLIDFGPIKMPAVSLGTSPFIGAGQFGQSSLYYREKFLNHPDNMVALIIKAVSLGIPCVHVLPYKEIIHAVKEAQYQLRQEIATYFTVGIGKIDEELDMAADIGSKVVFIHGSISDRCDSSQMSRLCKKVTLAGFIPGVATHQPDQTLFWIEDENIDFKVYMVAINPLGYLMGKDPNLTVELLKRTEKKIIAKKVLAAGKISPKGSFSYLKSLNIADGLTIGITSEEEMNQTFQIALELWPRKEK